MEKMNGILSDPKKKIYLPKDVKRILDKDLVLFEIRKKDGSPNRNDFLCRLIRGYYETFSSGWEMQYNSLLQEIGSFMQDGPAVQDLSNAILERIIFPAPVRKKGDSLVTVSLTIQDSIEHIVAAIQNKTNGPSESGYYCRMFTSYCRMPIWERERCIFKENYDTLVSAASRGQMVAITTKGGDYYEVIPYAVVHGPEEMFNYLLCQGTNPSGDANIAGTFRLSRINTVCKLSRIASVDPEIAGYLKRMETYGPQFAINDSKESVIHLTRKGFEAYQGIYYMRPAFRPEDMITNGDGSVDITFRCSREHLFQYFCKFRPGQFRVLKPDHLKNKFKSFYCKNGKAFSEQPDEI